MCGSCFRTLAVILVSDFLFTKFRIFGQNSAPVRPAPEKKQHKNTCCWQASYTTVSGIISGYSSVDSSGKEAFGFCWSLLYSAILRSWAARCTLVACGSEWVTAAFSKARCEYPPKWCTHSTVWLTCSTWQPQCREPVVFIWMIERKNKKEYK